MKRFYTTLAMAMVIAITSFAQLIPQGTMVPYTGMKRNTANVTKDNVLVTPPETAVIEDDWAIDAIYYYGENNIPYVNDNAIAVAFDGDVRTISVQFNMFDENAHRPAPFSSFDIRPPSSTACQ